MAGDFSRNTFDPSRHFSGVLMQQGRVLVDAEWNEQIDIQQHRDQTETRDVIGHCGTPKTEDGFRITQTPSGDDLLIAPGRYYVDGLLCELGGTTVSATFPLTGNHSVIVPYLYLDGYDLTIGQWVQISAAKNPVLLFTKITGIDTTTLTLSVDADISAYRNAGAVVLRRAVTYTTQPDYPTPKVVLSSPPHSPSGGSPVNLSDGDYLVYLVAWDREVNALEDPRIREVALGGPDTTERRQTVWQVRFLPVSSVTSPHLSPSHSSPPTLARCCDDFPEWEKFIAPPTGMMNAQTVPPTGDQGPCVLPPTAGFQRLENQLYRIEVFQGASTRDKSTFVWSRDNATVETTIVKVDGFDIFVTTLGKDDYFSFAGGQWVEIIFPESELSGQPRFLAQITAPPDTSGPNPRITLSIKPPAFSQADLSELRLVRWDMTGSVPANGLPMKAGWIDVEAGIQVQFLDGSYRTGDFWEIPARTATGDIEWPPFQVPNPNPVPQNPLGINRRYCCLAHLNVSSGVWNIHDCRKKFPALTHICADDVCYQGACDLPGVTTVQDAIDQLCQQRDLRFHNRHLHGWGIVCGLKVTCGPDTQGKPRRHITVSAGYAIDCNGNDVVLNQSQSFDVMSMVLTLPPPPPPSPPVSPPEIFPDGDYSLILDPSVAGGFRVESYVPKSFWDSVLNDTLLLDIYNDCLKSLVQFFQNQYPNSPPETAPLGRGQMLSTALNNLLVQYKDTASGSHVFISGDSNSSTESQLSEDFILRDFYTKFRKQLQSDVDCGLFDSARALPAYPFTGTGIATIFGEGSKTRLRVDPAGRLAYAVGAGSTIHIYDLNAQQLAAVVQFPAAGSAPGSVVVQDVAFTPDSVNVFAIATLNSTQTVFAQAAVSGTQLTWQNQVTLLNVVLSTLGTLTQQPGAIFAIGVGQGLYTFSVPNVFANPNPAPTVAFNAFGHLSIDQGSGVALATSFSQAGPAGSQPPFFDQIFAVNLLNQSSFPVQVPNGAVGTSDDDLLIFGGGFGILGDSRINLAARQAVPASSPLVQKLGIAPALNFGIAIVAFTTQGNLFLTNVLALFEGGPLTPINIGTTPARLSFNPQNGQILATLANFDRVLLADPLQQTVFSQIFPAQITPVSIAANSAGTTVYVLNQGSNTITAYPMAQLSPSAALDMNKLLAYRSGMINAFLDLLGEFLEDLKDCVCDHLLVECPTCDADDQLFLGVVSIRNQQVQKICNFSQRKYVKSFPTVDYWWSAIPIGRIIGKLVEMACCADIPAEFAAQSAPQPANQVVSGGLTGAIAGLDVNAFSGARALFQQSSITSFMQSAMSKFVPSQQFLTDFLVSKMPASLAAAAHTIPSNQVVGFSADAAKSRLATAGVGVTSVEQLDSGALAQNLTNFAIAPASLKTGDAVSLVVNQQNQVLYYTRTAPDVVALNSQVQSSQQQIKQTAAAVTQVNTLSQQLQASVTSTQQALAAAQPALTAASALQSRIANLETITAAQQSLLDSAKPLQTMVASLTAQLAAQQSANDQALAARDKQIADLTTQAKALQTQVQQLTARLPNTPTGGGTPAKG